MGAVAPAPQLRRTVAVVPRSWIVATVPKSVARWRWLPDPEGERRWGRCAGKRRHPRGPKAGEQAASPDVRVVTAPQEARGSSGVTEGTRCAQLRSRVTSSDPAHLWRPEWWPPSVLMSSMTSSSDYLLWFILYFDYCVLCLPHALLLLKNVRFYAWRRSSYISLLHAYFLHAHWKDNSLIYAIRNYHKKQFKSFMFVIARFLRLP
jgi:hypothetical protein